MTGRIPAAARLVGIVALCSGVAGLGYQMVWTRLLAVALGHEVAAVLAVVAAFFVGLAAGALTLNRRLRETQNPALWYCALELVIAVWALVLIGLVPLFNANFPLWLGAAPSPWFHWFLSFSATFILLSPATIAMGATVPALTGMAVAASEQHKQVGRVYALNTLGAVVGTLAMTFYWIPALGLRQSLLLLAAVNLLCAALAWWLYSKSRQSMGSPQAARSTRSKSPRLLLPLCFVSGWLGIGYEVVGIRVLSQILENTVYSFAVVLACYLFFNALGAAFYQRYYASAIKTHAQWSRFLNNALLAVALACLLGLYAFYVAEPVYFSLRGLLGYGRANAVAAELLTAAWIFALPTFAMGILFCHLAERAVVSCGLGKALALNTLGAALAPVSFGVILLPLMGAQKILAGAVLLYALLALPGIKTVPGRLRASYIFVLIAALGTLALPWPIRHWTSGMPAHATVQQYRDGVLASVAVVQSGNERFLKVNNHFTMGSSGTRYSDHRQTHLPLMLHGSPQSVLYLGLGTGVTMEAAGFYPNMNITGVELIPELPALMREFGVETNKHNVQIHSADARRFVLADTEHYDVIVGEIFHPSRDGAGALYTREHFSAVSERLAQRGLFAQWLPLFQLDLRTLKTIVATYQQVFPHTQMHLGHLSLQQPILCLVGSQQPLMFTEHWLKSRVTFPPLQRALVQVRLNSDFALFGSFLAGNEALAAFASGAPINTDDFPRVSFTAPDFVYSEQEPPAERLTQLLQAFAGPAKELPLAGINRHEFNEKLRRYIAARDQFIATGVAALGSDSITEMLAITRGPLLQIVRDSGEFEPAYRTLLVGAESLYHNDPKAAWALLTAMHDVRPDFTEARDLRSQLFGGAPFTAETAPRNPSFLAAPAMH